MNTELIKSAYGDVRPMTTWRLDARFCSPTLTDHFVCLRGQWDKHEDWWTSKIQQIFPAEAYADVLTQNHWYRVFYALHDDTASDQDYLIEWGLYDHVKHAPLADLPDFVLLGFAAADPPQPRIRSYDGISTMALACEDVYKLYHENREVLCYHQTGDMSVILEHQQLPKLQIDNEGGRTLCIMVRDGIYVIPPGESAIVGEAKVRVYEWGQA